MPERSGIFVDFNVPVPMRDGTILYADVYRSAANEPTPVLLTRTPYDKGAVGGLLSGFDAFRAVRAGYTVVVQDCRARRYSSGGDFYAFVNEAADGYDTVEWCAVQPWSTGKVGMFGGSYVGLTQWQAALTRPPHLAAIVPVVTASDYHDGWVYQGGAFELGFNLSWTLNALATDTLRRRREQLPDFAELWEANTTAIDAVACRFRDLPLKDFAPLKLGDAAPYYFDWLDHPDYDEYWQKLDVSSRHNQIDVPALNVGGWYDIFLGGTLRNFAGMRQGAATDQARQGQRLFVGPWAHGPFTTPVGEVDFGRKSQRGEVDLDGVFLRFYDRWLKGIRNGVDDEPPVRVFVMGENVWRSENEWPLARARNVAYYLRSEGKANTLRGDGVLSPERPGVEEPDHFLYDPRDPVPTRGGPLCCYVAALPIGPYDQRPVEERPDVLVYSTPPLDRDVEVTGPVSITLFAASSATDTDFTGKLVDVAPDGYARNLTEGIIRACYRGRRDQAAPIEPGRVYEYAIDLWATSNLFKAGHRIRVEISSSNFPRFDRNPNTGAPLGRDGELRPALQTVFHDVERPSRVVLPIVPR